MANDTTTPVNDNAGSSSGFWKKLSTLFSPPKRTGVHCIHCDWSGTRADVFKAPRLNEDGKVYMIDACPRCMRNGGLEYYD